VGEVASSNLVVPAIYFQLVTGDGHPKWVHGFEPSFVDFGFSSANFRIARHPAPRNFRIEPRFTSAIATSQANHESSFEFASQDCSAFLISMTFPSEWSSRSSEACSLYGGLPDPKLLDSETGDFQPDPRSIQQLIWRV
jgi:hypothetical protein